MSACRLPELPGPVFEPEGRDEYLADQIADYVRDEIENRMADVLKAMRADDIDVDSSDLDRLIGSALINVGERLAKEAA